MMWAAASRISHHLRLRDCDHHFSLGFGLGFCSSKIAQLPCPLSHSSAPITSHNRSKQRRRISLSCCILSSKSSEEIPFLSDSISQQEGDHELPSEGLSAVTGGIVALGKFDALHVGHRELAIQASKVGSPFLLSFVGMAEVLGWEPRAPIVAKCDRKRVLSSWAPYCGNIVPSEFQIEFSSVRQLTPQQFVEKLSKELGVRGVVAGENYRFGYKAAGDASDLVRLCEEYGIGAYIIKSVMDKNQSKYINASDSKERGQVSSTRVRRALAVGDMKYVSELLGRQHRLVLMAKDQDGFVSNCKSRISTLKSGLLNLAPKEGLYEKCFLCLSDDENLIPCRVVIDPTHIHIETDEALSCHIVGNQDSQLLHIEFGDSGA